MRADNAEQMLGEARKALEESNKRISVLSKKVKTILSDSRIDMHNIAIERCFRHIAMGKRNWLQTGSHFSAQNLAFMFGLLESCKLNKVNFGEYIEDILTRILCGEEVDASFLPCDYVCHFEDGTDEEVTNTSQAVA